MSRITQRFARLRESGRRALIPYVTAGDPSAAVTAALLPALVEAGADVLELGMPFSDPMADGPVIQRGSERALAGGMTLAGVLDLVSNFRRRDPDTPVVLMGYLNPVESMGYATFAERAAASGVDGTLIVDLPPEEGGPLLGALKEHGIDPIFLIAPNTGDARIAELCRHASGYLYYVSLKGVTGSALLDPAAVAERVARIKVHTELPVGVGFGISDAPAARRIAAVADAVIVGSALVRRIEERSDRPESVAGYVAELVGEMRAAMDG